LAAQLVAQAADLSPAEVKTAFVAPLDASHEAEAFSAEALDALQLEAHDADLSLDEVSTAFVADCSVAEFLVSLLAFLEDEQALSHA